MIMKLPTLYSRTSTGKIQEWTIEINGDTYRTLEGQKDGKITETLPTVCKPKNVGRSNATTAEEQALAEAKSKWQRKIESGYFENIADIDNETFTEPMLAQKYDEAFDHKFPVYTQPKLDGIRCVAKKTGLFTRNGKPILSVPHIHAALEPLWKAIPDAIFDGELYCDKLNQDFNKIASLVKKTKPTPEDLQESERGIQYHIYDYISQHSKPFSARNTQLVQDIGVYTTSPSLVLVKTYVASTQEALDKYYEEFLTSGYEGQMIRLDKPYDFKRSKSLLKRKEFTDGEYEVIDVFEGEGNRAGTAGYATLKLGKEDKVFRSNIKGNYEFLTEFLNQRENLKGKMVTVRSFRFTPDGVPRFPYIVSGARDFE